MMKEVVKVIEQEAYEYKDPITGAALPLQNAILEAFGILENDRDAASNATQSLCCFVKVGRLGWPSYKPVLRSNSRT